MHAGTAQIALLIILHACAAIAGHWEDAERLRRELTELIGAAPCNNLVNCRVKGLGARPCGGPEEYVASTGPSVVQDVFSCLAARPPR